MYRTGQSVKAAVPNSKSWGGTVRMQIKATEAPAAKSPAAKVHSNDKGWRQLYMFQLKYNTLAGHLDEHTPDHQKELQSDHDQPGQPEPNSKHLTRSMRSSQKV